MNELMKGVIWNRYDYDDGHCLNPEHKNYGVHIGVSSWICCPTCKIMWSTGVGNFGEADECIDEKETRDYQDFTGKEIEYTTLSFAEE